MTDFNVDIKADNDLCADDFTLRIKEQDNASYQWYKDGVAIANAT